MHVNFCIPSQATESIALLDMLLSFARLAESSNPGRPFGESFYTVNFGSSCY